MLLKRHYDPESVAAGSPVVTHLEVKHTGANAPQNFSTALVAEGLRSGFVSLQEDLLTLHAKPEDLRYTIKRRPGYYCCHNGARMELSAEAYGDPSIAAVEAQQYLKANGFDGASPDPMNPSGYMRLHQYECELDADQHARFKAVPGALAPSMKQEA
jgi:hypothetical protein